MIRVYLDWNAIAQMKDGHLDNLSAILFQKDRLFIPYSTSHIGDILAGYADDDQATLKKIDKDLNFITSLTDNYCLSNNGKQVVLDITCPHTLFKQRIEDADLLEGFGLGKFEDLFKIEGIPEGISEAISSLIKSIPIDESFNAILKDPATNEKFKILFPDLGENPTMEDFFRSFGKSYKNLNEKTEYKGYREMMQEGLGINRDGIFNSDDPYEIIKSAHSRLGFNWEDYVDQSKHAPEWFNKISNEYLMLDMHGYQEDKVEIKPKKRKQTFTNTIEDGFHAAFASTCQVYITNDKKSFAKTKKVYEKLGLNTIVFRPNEFIDYYSNYIGEKTKTIWENIQAVVEILNGDNFEEEEIDNGIRRIYHTSGFIFDFFNGITRQWDNETGEVITMLFRDTPTNYPSTFTFEVRNLISKIDPEFLQDDKNAELVSDDVLKEENWAGIRWGLGDMNLYLLGYQGLIQLYLHFPESKSTENQE